VYSAKKLFLDALCSGKLEENLKREKKMKMSEPPKNGFSLTGLLLFLHS
jgi:hypothetical protein